MLKPLDALSRALGVVEQVALGLSLALMIAFAFTQVALRFLPGEVQITWFEPFARQLVLWVGLLGASLATAENRHISIEAVPKLLTPRQKKALAVVVHLSAALVAALLGWLALLWLIDVDREEIAAAHRVSELLEARAEAAVVKTREETIEALRGEARRRVDLARLRGFARLLRDSGMTMMRLEDADPYAYPFVNAARRLARRLELDELPLEAKALPETCERLAAGFEEAAAAYESGDRTAANALFADQPAGPDVASSLGDPVSIALFDVVASLEGDVDAGVPELLQEKARQTLQVANQKAFMVIGGQPVHEWWFHTVVPLALAIMAFRFLVNAIAALSLSPEALEERLEALHKDVESYEAQEAEADEAPNEPTPPPEDPEPPASAAAAERVQTERLKAPTGEGLRLENPDEEVPTGALETQDLDEGEGMFDDVDKSPPPLSSSGIVPRKGGRPSEPSDDGDDDEDLDEAVLDELGRTDEDITEDTSVESSREEGFDDEVFADEASSEDALSDESSEGDRDGR